MLEKLNNQPFVVFDIETTGLNYAGGDEIIEIAAQKMINGEVREEFHHLICPGVPVGKEAEAVHGLSDEYLREHGKQAIEILPQFLTFSKDSILVGHNILGFDIGFVNAQLQKMQLSKLDNYVVDTLIMSRKLMTFLPNHRLSTVAEHFGFETGGAHRALFDVDMNRRVFLELLKIYSGEKAPTAEKSQLF